MRLTDRRGDLYDYAISLDGFPRLHAADWMQTLFNARAIANSVQALRPLSRCAYSTSSPAVSCPASATRDACLQEDKTAIYHSTSHNPWFNLAFEDWCLRSCFPLQPALCFQQDLSKYSSITNRSLRLPKRSLCCYWSQSGLAVSLPLRDGLTFPRTPGRRSTCNCFAS